MPSRKLLIANRGEIAIRIARAAADAGLATVAIYPADDAASLHVRTADESHEMAEAFGVWGEKVNYGRKYMGIVRSAFVINAQGKIAAAFYKIAPKDTMPKVTQVLGS